VEKIEDPTNYFVVDYIAGGGLGVSCRKTFGYTFNRNENKVYAFSSVNTGAEVTTSMNGGSGCSSKNVGKYVRTGNAPIMSIPYVLVVGVYLSLVATLVPIW